MSAAMSSDLDLLKEIPGYKAILKSVLKSQIQLLVEQLADNTGEESIILTASINDGTLSHLGSTTGKGFLDGKDEIKSQFLGYCLKSHHRKKSHEPRSPYQRGDQGPSRPSAKRPRASPVPLRRNSSQDGLLTTSGPPGSVQDPIQNMGLPPGVIINTNNVDSEARNVGVKTEDSDASDSQHDRSSIPGSTPVVFPLSLHLSHTQTSNTEGDSVGDTKVESESTDQNNANGADGSSQSAAGIKVEPITESEMELEITGVEPGNASRVSGEGWAGPRQMGYLPGGTDGDESLNQSVDQSGYTTCLPKKISRQTSRA